LERKRERREEERRSEPKRGTIVSQPIEERGENTGKCTKKKTIKQKNLHKHSLYIRKEIELKQGRIPADKVLKYLRFYSKK